MSLFLNVSPSFKRGKDLGSTDVILKVEDRFPVRAFVGVDDSGIKVIGKDRFYAGFNWANVFGIDHRLTYEYVTDTDLDKFNEHVASYVLPLPWHHEVTFFGAYANVNPDLKVIDPSLASLANSGRFYQLSGRYSIPLPSL